MDNLVHIETYSDEMEAKLAQATLHAVNIDSMLQIDGADNMLPFTTYVKGVKLFVNPENVEEAKNILENQATPTDEEPTAA